MSETANSDRAPSAPRVVPGILLERVNEERDRIAAFLEAVNARRMIAVDQQKAARAQIEKRRREIEDLERGIVELDAVIASCDAEREDQIALDDALAEEYRAIERVLKRRAGR